MKRYTAIACAVLVAFLTSPSPAATGDQLAKLLPGDGAEYDYFGASVGISGNTMIVGSHGDDDNGTYSGSAYLFDAMIPEPVTLGLFVLGGAALLRRRAFITPHPSSP